MANARVTLGTTSKMLRYENLETLIELCATRPALDLLFVGDGPERDRLERRAAPLNGARPERVRFTGRVPAAEIPERLMDIDVFVVPRRHLTTTRFASPLEIVEAMAAARAFVATSVGDVTTLLADGGGELVPPGDPRALGAAIDALAESRTRRTTLGERDTLLASYGDVYAAALGRAAL